MLIRELQLLQLHISIIIKMNLEEKNQESHFYRPGVDTISFLIFICRGI